MAHLLSSGVERPGRDHKPTKHAIDLNLGMQVGYRMDFHAQGRTSSLWLVTDVLWPEGAEKS